MEEEVEKGGWKGREGGRWERTMEGRREGVGKEGQRK